MQDSIFTKIVRGEIPCHKVYEDKLTLAFLDIHPKQPGHTLVIPKKQVEFVWDLEDEDYQALMAAVKKVALRIRHVMARTYVGEMVIGEEVPHAHIHVFPFDTVEQFRAPANPNHEPDHDKLAEISKSIAFR